MTCGINLIGIVKVDVDLGSRGRLDPHVEISCAPTSLGLS